MLDISRVEWYFDVHFNLGFRCALEILVVHFEFQIPRLCALYFGSYSNLHLEFGCVRCAFWIWKIFPYPNMKKYLNPKDHFEYI